ncbi:MAG: ribulose-phosphate 3-epimerase [Burkholderiaceae bacterium]
MESTSAVDRKVPARLPVVIAPSILSADFSRLGEEVRALQASGADWVHFDVMDNHYVPNLSVGPMVCAAVRQQISLPLDVHLMVEDPDRLIGAFAQAGADLISIHPETTRHPDRTLQLIRDAGCQAGLVLNPGSSLGWLDHLMERLDLVLLMSVNPGFGGQSFIPSALPKLQAARARIDRHVAQGGSSVRLEIDGGVKADNIAAIAAAGADTFVAGSAVFSAPDPDGHYREVIARLRAGAGGA